MIRCPSIPSHGCTSALFPNVATIVVAEPAGATVAVTETGVPATVSPAALPDTNDSGDTAAAVAGPAVTSMPLGERISCTPPPRRSNSADTA
jgi:hypothetical protein